MPVGVIFRLVNLEDNKLKRDEKEKVVEVEVEMLPESDKGGRGVDERENEGNRRITKEVVGKIQLSQVCEGG